MQKIFTLILVFATLVAFSQESISAQQFQDNLNKSFADSLSSPLLEKDLKEFKGLDFYPIDEKYIVKAKFKKSKNQKAFEMKTSTERLPKYIKYGEISFVLNGEKCKLNVYQNLELIKRKEYKNYLFLPFSDSTSGNETYIGGRYLDLEIPLGNSIIIDFNKAYNPYCAYNYKYSCPLVPLENDLKTAVKAGVKKFHD